MYKLSIEAVEIKTDNPLLKKKTDNSFKEIALARTYYKVI